MSFANKIKAAAKRINVPKTGHKTKKHTGTQHPSGVALTTAHLQTASWQLIQTIGSSLGKGDAFLESTRRKFFRPIIAQKSARWPRYNSLATIIAQAEKQTKLIRECRVLILDYMLGRQTQGSAKKHARMVSFKRGLLRPAVQNSAEKHHDSLCTSNDDELPSSLLPPPRQMPPEGTKERDRWDIHKLMVENVRIALSMDKMYTMMHTWLDMFNKQLNRIQHNAQSEHKHFVCPPIPELPNPKLPIEWEFPLNKAGKPINILIRDPFALFELDDNEFHTVAPRLQPRKKITSPIQHPLAQSFQQRKTRTMDTMVDWGTISARRKLKMQLAKGARKNWTGTTSGLVMQYGEASF